MELSRVSLGACTLALVQLSHIFHYSADAVSNVIHIISSILRNVFPGKGCGSILGGLIYEVYGAVVLFRGCAVAAAVVFIFYFLVQQLLSCKTTDVTTPSDKEHELGKP